MISLLFSLTGCPHLQTTSGYETAVTNDPAVWDGFEKDSEYIVYEPLFLRKKVDSISSRIVALETYKKPMYDSEVEILDEYPSLEQYNKSQQNWPDIVGVLYPGTRIQPSKVVQRGALLWDSSLLYYADIKTGPYRNTEIDISNLCLLHNCDRTPMTRKPDPRILRPVIK